MQAPYRSEQEASSHEVFTALMWALSYPGEKQQTEQATLRAIGEALLDLETSFYCSDERLAKAFLLTTSKIKSLEQADYLFFSQPDDAALEFLTHIKRGTLLYPDHAATVVIECAFVNGLNVKLSGPGIASANTLNTSLPLKFWQIRNQLRNYPLGWDIFLCDGTSIVGIPRTTEVAI